MPRYRYEAVDNTGEVLHDEIEAPTPEAAVERLRDQGLLPLSVNEAQSGFLRGGFGQPLFSKRRALSRKSVTLLTQQLANLLHAGMPLDRALTILISVSENEQAQNLLERVQEKVRGGASLADALEAQGAFSRFYLNMIRAGEAGGALEVVLKRLTEFLERSQALRETVTSALIYPIILLSVSALSVIILLTFVVPQFQQLFADAGKALPLATQIVIAVGDGFRHYWWVGAIVLVLIVAALRQQLSQPVSRARWDRWFLRLPLFGDFDRQGGNGAAVADPGNAAGQWRVAVECADHRSGDADQPGAGDGARRSGGTCQDRSGIGRAVAGSREFPQAGGADDPGWRGNRSVTGDAVAGR